MSTTAGTNRAFFNQLRKYYTFYTGGFIAFVIVLAILEQIGLPKVWIGYAFLFATIGLYAGIGIMSRTTDVAEYYVAGRRVPAFFNGMATGADWMSAASFIGMAGTLYLTGFDGLAFVMGWTGGYVLVALFLAPYLRKFGQFTIPDFLGARYGGNIPRSIGIFAAILCSFTYVVAQIYGVGIITTRFTGVAFERRRVRRPGRHPGLLVPRRHARGHLDPGGAVHHPDHRVPDAGGLALGQDHRRSGSAVGLRPGAAESHRQGRRAAHGAGRSRGARYFKKNAADAKARVDALPASWEAGRAAAAKQVDDLKAANSAGTGHACGGKGADGLSGVSRRRAKRPGPSRWRPTTPRQLLRSSTANRFPPTRPAPRARPNATPRAGTSSR